MLKIFYNTKTHQLERVDVENKISYDWEGNTPHVADFPNLLAVNTSIKTDRKRDIVYKTRWEIALVVFIVCLFITIWNIDIQPNTQIASDEIIKIQKMITNFDNQNKSSFGDWRTCKIIQECIGKSDSEIQKIIESNFLEVHK